MKNKKIFIACPISKYFDCTTHGMEGEFKNFIINLLNTVRKHCNNVFLALEREKYGHARMEGHECTPLDFQEIQNSDLMIAIPEDSMGVAVELGWASSLKKEIIIVVQNKYKYSPLIKALHTITNAKYIELKDMSNESIKTFEAELVRLLIDKTHLEVCGLWCKKQSDLIS